MRARAFRLGVVAAPAGGPEEWRRTALRVEELGYSTLLMPDGPQLLSPVPSLAVAASVTSRLRVGTFVLASPLRAPWLAAWDAHSLSVLVDGRFELGIGTGHPDVVRHAVELGLAPGPTGRLERVEQTIAHLRELDADRHTPVMVAASGPRARALAAEQADVVTLGVGPLVTGEEFGGLAGEVWQAAGNRADRLELAENILAVGDRLPPGFEEFMGTGARAMIEHGSLAMLRGTPAQMADELLRRRDAFGTSYAIVNAAFAEELAPVVERLAGR